MPVSKWPWIGVLASLLVACSPSGEDAVQLEVAADPTVTLKVWFDVGSHDDPPGKEGLAYLTGQMLAEGSTTENEYERILEKLFPLASSYSIRVDREMTVLSGRTHRDNLEVFFGLFHDAFARPAFSQEDFERIRTNALNYLKNTLRYASDEELGKAALYSFVFEGTGYAHPPQGTVASLESITVQDVKSFYESHFTAKNARIALGGGYPAALAGRFSSALGDLPAGPAPEPTPPPEPAPFEGKHVLLVAKQGADASISFGFPIDVRRGDPDFYALWLANSWLGEHRNSSSHLYQVIRAQRGMNYGDYSYIEAFPEGGRRSVPPTHVGRSRQLFEVWIRTLPDADAHFAIRAAMRELRSLVDNGLTQEQFELTREFLKKYVLHFAETTATRLGYAVDDRFYGIDPPGHLARFRQAMEALTLAQVNGAIERHLQYDDVKFAIVTGAADELAAALAEERASHKTYPPTSPKAPEILEEDEMIAEFPLGIDGNNIRIVPVDRMFEGDE